MLRLRDLESKGCRCAAMSGCAEGDCAIGAPDPAARRAFIAALALDPSRLTTPRQVHGAKVIVATENDAGRGALGAADAHEADAIMTNLPGLTIGVTVADCVPIWLLDPRRGAAAVVHAGRPGTMLRIAQETVSQFCAAYGSAPGDLHATIGPSAGPCCYEVAPDMVEAFARAGWRTHGRNLDLWQANQAQLLESGLPASQISLVGHCTICQPGFHSYRAHKTAKRNLVIITL